MATRSRRTRVSRGTGSRRKFIWARQFVNETFSLASPVFIDALDEVQIAIGADLIGSTLVRVRGEIIMSNTSAGGGAVNVMAMRSFTTSTLAGLGVANDPVGGDPLADWMLWEPFAMTGSGNLEYNSERRIIDVKSSRRLEEVGQSILLAFGSGTVDQQQVAGVLSLGIKLP